MNYFVFSFDLGGNQTEQIFEEEFLQISSNTLFDIGNVISSILAGTGLTWLLCWIICFFRKNSSGIEKASMSFMPILFLLTLVLTQFAWSVQLEGAYGGDKEALS